MGSDLSPKTVPKLLHVLISRLLVFIAIIVWAWHVQSGHPYSTERAHAVHHAATSLQGTNFLYYEKFVNRFLYRHVLLEARFV